MLIVIVVHEDTADDVSITLRLSYFLVLCDMSVDIRRPMVATVTKAALDLGFSVTVESSQS